MLRNSGRRPAGIRLLPSLLTMGLLMLLLAGPAYATHTTAWKAPTEGSTVSGVLQGDKCEATSSSPLGVERVEFYVDGALNNTERYAPYNCLIDSNKLTEGAHVLKARGITNGGAVSEHSINVTADNVPETLPPTPSGPRSEHRGAQVHSLWGDSSLDDARRELDMLQSAGADTVRVDLSWSSLEQNGKGQYSQWYVDKADAVIDAAAARGLKVVAAFHTTPCWASSAPDSLKQDCTGAWWDRNVQNYPPQSAPDYADAAAWVARRWGDRMAALEIWNEPNEANQSFLVSSDPAAAYVALVKAAYSPVKNARPDLPVLAGATSFADRAFIQRLYSLGMKGYFDGLSIHPYNESRDPDDARSAGLEKWTFRSGVPWVREAMVANGDADKGLWLTEFGWSTCASGSSSWCVTESKQAEYVEDAFRIAREDDWSYVKAMLVYNLRNKGTATTDREAQFGLLQRDFSPKPGWEGFRNAMAQ